MTSWPSDAPQRRVLAALGRLGYRVVRFGNHISLRRLLADGSRTTMTLPNHQRLQASTLQTACRRAGIDRDDFLDAYRRSK